MLMLRMTQAVFATFRVVYEEEGAHTNEELLSESLHTIESVIRNGMEGHLTYQVATLEKLFCVVVLRRPATAALAATQPFYAPLPILVQLLVFVRQLAAQVYRERESRLGD